jgi:menaquinone-dependent protoporphyrinogen IX oxidase
MVDLLALFSVVIFVIIGIPTAILIVGRVIGYFACYSATESQTEKPESDQKGKALIVYEPGATKQAQKVGAEIGDLLLERGYEVTLTGIMSETAKNTSGYDLVLLGTPTYVGRPTGVVKKYVKNLHLASDQTFGIYLIGTKGAPMPGFVPKAFLNAMKKPLEESETTVKEMAFSGYGQFDYPDFVATLCSTDSNEPAGESQDS